MPKQLILASASPRRQEILGWLGIPHRVVKSNFSELTAQAAPWLSPGELAQYNAVGKAENVQFEHPYETILAADTVVALGTRIFEKPVDLEQARSFLRQLSGKPHHVLTALALAHPEHGLNSLVTSTRVRFKKLSPKTIDQYLQQVPVLDKAGAYAVQQHGDWIIQTIEGSVTNVIGLPVESLAHLFIKSTLGWLSERSSSAGA